MDHGGEVMSQFYTTAPAQSPPTPREGLPPCLRLTTFDSRVACGAEPCAACERTEWLVQTGNMTRVVAFPHHPGTYSLRGLRGRQLEFDDPAEAEAAWVQAERWVRTGVLDEG